MDNDLLTKYSALRFIEHDDSQTIFTEKDSALVSFAIDDAIATSVGAGDSLPTLRTWIHDKTLVLGIPDGRLPFLTKGIKFANKHGYKCIIRNSGGLAVALDTNILNVSLIIPRSHARSINDSYELMYALITDLFKPYTDRIAAYEIVGSYCPGDYDLSIDGKKFAGISQRRVRDGIAVQIYIDIAGDSVERAGIVQEFYQTSLQGQATKFDYPEVDPNVMRSLQSLLNTKLTVSEVIKQLHTLVKNYGVELIDGKLTTIEQGAFEMRLQQMYKRNQSVLQIESNKTLFF